MYEHEKYKVRKGVVLESLVQLSDLIAMNQGRILLSDLIAVTLT